VACVGERTDAYRFADGTPGWIGLLEKLELDQRTLTGTFKKQDRG